MKKSELVKAVAKATGEKQNVVNTIMTATFEEIAKAMEKAEAVQTSFGIFNPVRIAEKKGRNPKTNEEIVIPARNTVKLKLSLNLKKRLNNQ